MNVDRDRVNILKNGSRMGYLVEPHNDKCSRMCGIPVLSLGVVRSATLTACRQHITRWQRDKLSTVADLLL